MKQKDVIAKMKELGFVRVTRRTYRRSDDNRDACEFHFFGARPPHKCFCAYFKKRVIK